MNRSVTAFLPLAGDARSYLEILAGDPGRWLPPPADPLGPHEWTVHLRAGPAAYPVVFHVGADWSDSDNLWRPVTWSPRGSEMFGRLTDRALPAFVGEVGLVTVSQPTLTLTGEYDPPGGVVGTLSDRAVLHRLADTTARRFLTDVAHRISSSLPARDSSASGDA